jgi:hypothetical protein
MHEPEPRSVDQQNVPGHRCVDEHREFAYVYHGELRGITQSRAAAAGERAPTKSGSSRFPSAAANRRGDGCRLRRLVGPCSSHRPEVSQKNAAHAIQPAPRATAIQGSYLLPPRPGNCPRLFSFQTDLSNRFMPAITSLLKTMNATPTRRKAMAAIFECISMRPNVQLRHCRRKPVWPAMMMFKFR